MDQSASHQKQSVPDSSRKVRTFAGLAFCLVFPSCGAIQKYFGNLGLLIYLIAASAILWIAYRYLSELFLSRLSERQAQFPAVATFIALIAVFALVYSYSPPDSVDRFGRKKSVIQTGTLSLTSTSYGVFVLFFGVLAFGPKTFEVSDA